MFTLSRLGVVSVCSKIDSVKIFSCGGMASSRKESGSASTSAHGAMAQEESSGAYHHGDLRQALLDATQSVLDEKGLEGFTLRECARRAGVSHAAPAHHFGDAMGLLTAFATLGFERMGSLMQDYRDVAGREPAAQLRAVGLAYVDFAIRYRAHFQLMFRRDRLDAGNALLRAAGERAASHLSDTLAAVIKARGIVLAQGDMDDRLLLAWSAVHGFATLLLEGRLDGWRGRQPVAKFAAGVGDRVLALLELALVVEPSSANEGGKRKRPPRGVA